VLVRLQEEDCLSILLFIVYLHQKHDAVILIKTVIFVFLMNLVVEPVILTKEINKSNNFEENNYKSKLRNLLLV